jgi:hypothetical protein
VPNILATLNTYNMQQVMNNECENGRSLMHTMFELLHTEVSKVKYQQKAVCIFKNQQQ